VEDKIKHYCIPNTDWLQLRIRQGLALSRHKTALLTDASTHGECVHSLKPRPAVKYEPTNRVHTDDSIQV